MAEFELESLEAIPLFLAANGRVFDYTDVVVRRIRVRDAREATVLLGPACRGGLRVTNSERLDILATAVVLSQREARAMGDEAVAPHHLLLGLVAEDRSAAGFLAPGVRIDRRLLLATPVLLLAPDANARCAADGNEMMRFQCRASEAGEVICAAVATTGPSSAVRTFASSGVADAGAGGGAPGRRGMLVCRVIAGRVQRAADTSCHAGDYDSLDAGGGELVVLDSRAVLPCFLVIYRVNNHQASELY